MKNFRITEQRPGSCWPLVLLCVALFASACATPGTDTFGPKETGKEATTPRAEAVKPATVAKDVSPSSQPAAQAKPDAVLADAGPRIIKGSGVLVKPQPSKQPPSSGGTVSVNFEAADIREVTKTIVADILQESYIVDPKVQGTVTLRTTRPLPREALLPTLETVLKSNGAILVKENNVYKVLPSTAARGSLTPQVRGNIPGYSVQIVPLRYIGVKEMAKILEPFAPEGGILRVDELRNLLIVAGSQNEIQHMLETIDTFDVDWLSGMSIGLFPLKTVDVKTVASELEKILGDKNQNPLSGVLRAIPIERLNAFVVITPQPEYLERARSWIERLDRGGGSAGKRLFVYRVQNGKAESIATLLSQLFGDMKPQATKPAGAAAPSLAPGLVPIEIKSPQTGTTEPSSGMQQGQAATSTRAAGAGAAAAGEGDVIPQDVKIIADKENNSLIIHASVGDYEKIEAALRRLDVAPRQVLIEAMIAEVTLTGDLQFGLEWFFTNGPRQRGQLDTGAAGISVLTPGFSYIWRDTASAIRVVLNALATDRKVNVLSSPHIMVSDNQTAKIQVGDSVPVAGPQIITGGGVVSNSVQYIDTGIILSVTPQINASGLVNLEINQEVSNASLTLTSGLNSPTISKRSTSSKVTVQSGESMVLGGLISEARTHGTSGLPFLSQIPVIGGLFGSQTYNTVKTELIVLVTPRVLNDTTQARAATEEFKKRLGEVGDILRKLKAEDPSQNN